MSNVSSRRNIVGNLGGAFIQEQTPTEPVKKATKSAQVETGHDGASLPGSSTPSPAAVAPSHSLELKPPESDALPRSGMKTHQPENIAKAQDALRAAGFSVPFSSKWDEMSRAALRAYQCSVGMGVSGQWDDATQRHLAWGPVTQGQEILGFGSRGFAVERLQEVLSNQFQHKGLALNGEFDEATHQAVRSFQTFYPNLQVDGLVGAHTAQALDIFQVRTGNHTLRSGSRGPVVERIQKALEFCGHQAGLSGIYGASTTRAVRSFQREQGLNASGSINAETFESLERSVRDVRRSRERVSSGPELEVFPLPGNDFQLGHALEDAQQATLDVFAPAGTRVMAPVSGVVSNIRRRAEDDFSRVTVRRGDYYYAFGHLGSVAQSLRVGSPLKAGDKIGTVGVPTLGQSDEAKIQIQMHQSQKGQEMKPVSAFRYLMNWLQRTVGQ